jgi:hypothetical protein
MDNFTIRDVVFGLLGSGGFITGCILLFNAITTRLDARKKRIEERRLLDISQSTDALKLEGDETDRVISNLWKVIELERKENEELRVQIKEWEVHEKLARPTVSKVYRLLRNIRAEIDHINVLFLDDKQTAVFAKRWNNIRIFADEIENVLSGDESPPNETGQK